MLAPAGVPRRAPRPAPARGSAVLPVTSPLVADTVALPRPTAVARPFESAALLTVPTASSVENQLATVGTPCVEAAVYRPAAVSSGAGPQAMLASAAATPIHTTVAP